MNLSLAHGIAAHAARYTRAEMAVLRAMAHFADGATGLIWAGIPKIALQSRYSERQVQRVMDGLRRKGVLQPLGGGAGKNHNTKYQVHPAGCAGPLEYPAAERQGQGYLDSCARRLEDQAAERQGQGYPASCMGRLEHSAATTKVSNITPPRAEVIPVRSTENSEHGAGGKPVETTEVLTTLRESFDDISDGFSRHPRQVLTTLATRYKEEEFEEKDEEKYKDKNNIPLTPFSVVDFEEKQPQRLPDQRKGNDPPVVLPWPRHSQRREQRERTTATARRHERTWHTATDREHEPGVAAAAGRVMLAMQLSDPRMLPVVVQALLAWLADPVHELREAERLMVLNWDAWLRAAPMMRYVPSVRRFIERGLWYNHALWPLDQQLVTQWKRFRL